MSSSQLTFTPSFFRGVGQPPTSLVFWAGIPLRPCHWNRRTASPWWPNGAMATAWQSLGRMERRWHSSWMAALHSWEWHGKCRGWKRLERRCFLEALKKEKLGAIEICEHWGHFAGVMEEVKVKIGQVQVGSLGFLLEVLGITRHDWTLGTVLYTMGCSTDANFHDHRLWLVDRKPPWANGHFKTNKDREITRETLDGYFRT